MFLASPRPAADICVTEVKYILLLAATKLGQGNVFTGVCDSVNREGVYLSAYWDPPRSRHSPGADTPPRADTSPEQTHTPWTRHPPDQTPPSGPDTPTPESRLWHTVNKRPVRILLECILVFTRKKKSTEKMEGILHLFGNPNYGSVFGIFTKYQRTKGINLQTRMHSSRMRTARGSSRQLGGGGFCLSAC